MDQISVTLVGGSGLVGSELLKILGFIPQVTAIKLVSRSPMGRIPARTENLIMPLKEMPSHAEALKSDVFICCLGSTMKKAGSKEAFREVDFDYVVNFAKVAEKVGAQKLLVVSAMGADAGSKFFYNQVKGEMEKAIRALNIPQVEIFRPSLILGDRKEARSGEDFAKVLSTVINPLMIGPLKKYKAIEASIIARAMAIAALNFHPGRHTYESSKIQEIGDQIKSDY